MGRQSPKSDSKVKLPATRKNSEDVLRCVICNRPIPVESAKTDDKGHAVHEDCYLLRVRLKDATKP